jgi:hypothetical protein
MRVYPIAALLGMAALGMTASARGEESTKTEKAREEVRKDKQKLKEKLDENRAELKEKGDKLNKELKDKRDDLNKEANDKRTDLKEAEAKLRETRAERKKSDRAAVREKYGDLLTQPAVIDELRTHASRMARLNRIKELADDQKQTKITDRVNTLIDRENNRHDARMQALKDNGGKATTAAVTGTPTTNARGAKGDTK